ncbi:MAG: LVIVD repeat-containing protein, partial [Longimicrobiaceae bacterium]
SEPRVFADLETGGIAGLWGGGDHGPGTQRTSQTNQCHDITAYPEIGLAAGACAGNGILFDISEPESPVRIHEVSDPNFAYWHSATFSNDGSKVIFTDEWGGGSAPRCRATEAPEWGANAIFDIADRRLRFASYYKLPAPQTETENCVAHNGSLIPVPGRDIKVQAWYQGGISVFDFTDSQNPVEIAFFDRGPVSATELMTGGYWSSYWYNGYVYGSEIARGFDVFQLTPSEHLSQNEIDAARLVRMEEFNPQHQTKLVWPASFVVARAYLDQLRRNGGLQPERLTRVAGDLDAAERLGEGTPRRSALTELATQLEGAAQGAGDPERVRALAGAIRELAGAQR